MFLNYERLTDYNFEQFTDYLKRVGSIALDTETYYSKVVLITLATHERQFYVDAVEDFDFAKRLIQYLSDSEVALIGHNIKYDYKVIYETFSIHLQNTLYDTLLASMVLDCGLDVPKGHHSLESLTRRITDLYAYSSQGYLGLPYVSKKVRDSFFNLAYPFSNEQITYAILDAYYTYCDHINIYPILQKEQLIDTYRLECDFTRVVAIMELNGLPFDKEAWLKLAQLNEHRTQQALEELQKIAQINWNSPKQVAKVFELFDIDTTVKGKDGNIKQSVSRVHLADKKEDIVIKYLTYKELSKKSSTYGVKFVQKYYNSDTGRIHTNIFQILDTGRTSSSNPNCQNIPHDEEFRSCFKAPKGYKIIKADYGQIEARVLASLSKERVMIDMFESGLDYHTETAKKIYKRDDITKDSPLRRTAKSVGFAILFGGGPKTIHERYGVPLEEAKTLVANYFDAFPTLKRYFDEGKKKAIEDGYIIIDDVIRRKSRLEESKRISALLPLVKRDLVSKRLISGLEAAVGRKFQNYRPQGTAASIAKLAGIRLLEALKPYDAQILLLVHDEYVVLVKEEQAEEVSKIVKKTMEDAATVFSSVEVPVDVKIADHW